MVAFHELTVPLFSFILLILFLKRRRSTAGKIFPPSPRKLPIIGNLHQLGKSPHRSLLTLSKRHGELMLLHLGSKPVLVASSAAAAREIMKNQDLIFSNRPKLSAPDRLTYGSRDVAFSPYGEYWRHVRSICVLQLLSNRRVQSFRRVREEETSLMIERIARSPAGAAVNLSEELVATTNDVICRVALGRKYGGGGEERRFKKFLSEFVELLGASPVGDLVTWLAWVDRVGGLDAKVERVARLFDEFLEHVVREHREVEKSGRVDDEELDFVDILLQFQRENEKTSPVEDETIKALILDMFAGGTDTTVSSMEWTMAELIRNPRTMKVLQNEVREVARNKVEVDEEDLEKMPYLKAVMKESLRLHSPVPLLVPRESTEDTKVLGCDVASGTRVMVNAWAISRDPSLWENPEEFCPERFLDTSIDYKGLHFEFIPFGAGRRGCPAVAFAMSVNELAIAKLVHKFNFGLANGGRGEDLDMSETIGIAVHKKLPLLVVV
ncbi:cytochrome P450 71A6-like [Salvia splendens]|uniref:cytochrome P450 71A6-like n=1 Tax=Salvia splendens TaxID=180675 RepID=UPI001C253B12|nr:cytochrome P450 71A6-like [Salvia splendens]